jgi:cyclopropane-fatty-acyl-phospholipid synthase
MNRREYVRRLLADCGIQIEGGAAHDIHIANSDFYARVISQGSLGLGESYMEGWWDAPDLESFICRLLTARLDERVRSWRDALAFGLAALFNPQRRSRAFEVGERHYDLGNDLYRAMLDRRLIYSCGFWGTGADTLEEAQEAKLDLVFRKLGLKPGQRLLDIGCGWGGALKLAAERYGIEGTGVTVSREQAEFASHACQGLPVRFLLEDYRGLNETFDHIYSIGMFEHVGVKNYRTYMKTVHRCLRADGLFLLHTIGSVQSSNHTDPWIDKYIFPNSMIPSQRQISEAIDGLFLIQGWQRIGEHYERTLLAWRNNFERHWPHLRATRDDRFYRMWRFYLSASAASFRARKLDVWQVLLAPVPG